ncbi:SH3 domain-containing protein [Xanthomonas sp. 3075]|uniref:SH3 domain-containing protein n=1 Tax=Xanthomonas sp. 3075 TaxID=3035315 RepID=UPI00161B5FF0|nr:SH3 domain-containing protein [Xanthomonas sp. 3075]MBB4132448.1 uncharacterized protein YgiM (DUF1202 family) [Xanthomonas sp. 3075]
MTRHLSWIAGGLMAVAFPVVAQQISHASSSTSLRAGPAAEFRRVGDVQQGNTLQVYGCLKNTIWCDVRSPDSRGWMLAKDIAFDRKAVTRVVSFSLDDYWDAHYRGREWTVESERALWRDYMPGDAPSLDMMAPSNDPGAGPDTIAKRVKQETRANNERTARERAQIDAYQRSRIRMDRQQDELHRCKRSGLESSAVKSCIDEKRTSFENEERQREFFKRDD